MLEQNLTLEFSQISFCAATGQAIPLKDTVVLEWNRSAPVARLYKQSSIACARDFDTPIFQAGSRGSAYPREVFSDVSRLGRK